MDYTIYRKIILVNKKPKMIFATVYEDHKQKVINDRKHNKK